MPRNDSPYIGVLSRMCKNDLIDDTEEVYRLVRIAQAGMAATKRLSAAHGRLILSVAENAMAGDAAELSPFERWQRAHSAFVHAIRTHLPERHGPFEAHAERVMRERFARPSAVPKRHQDRQTYDDLLRELGPVRGKGPTPRTLARYIVEAQRGHAAFERLVMSNTRLVRAKTRRMPYIVDAWDQFVEGTLGLMHGIKKFDPGRGYKLSTYAQWWINQAIYRSGLDASSLIRIPVHTRDHMLQATRVAAHLRGGGVEPTPALVAAKMNENREARSKAIAERTGGVPQKGPTAKPGASARSQAKGKRKKGYQYTATDVVAFQSTVILRPVLLSQPRLRGDGSGDGDTVGDSLTADPAAVRDQHDALVAKRHADAVAAALASLPTVIERRIIARRFGLETSGGSGYEETLNEIGDSYNLSRERIRQIEAVALKRMAAALRAQGLIPTTLL